MVLAGAGSGKTRVITARLARLWHGGIDPRAIIALTFTNKAAAEMRERAGISGRARRAPTVCTFHAFGLQLVRRHAAELGFRAGKSAAPVTVYDQHDSAQLLRDVAGELRLDADLADADPALLQRLVSGLRMGGAAGAPDVETAGEQLRGLVAAYRRRLRLYQAVDFDDLILLPLELLRGAAGDAIRARYSHVMVDEFQDTSRRQYQLMHGLTAAARNICVVGDDDQSIYSWRGAEAANFDHFSRDFPERLEVKLEQNYRSTGSILAFANAIISHNSARRTKRLWSRGGAGARVVAAYPESDAEEAEWIVRQIRSLALGSGLRYADCAVLVRANQPHPRAGGGAAARGDRLPGVRRHELLQPPRGTRPDRLPAGARQSGRRRQHAPHRQHAAPRSGCRRLRAYRRYGGGARLLSVLGNGADRQRQGGGRAKAAAHSDRRAGGVAGTLRGAHPQRGAEPGHGAGAGGAGRRAAVPQPPAGRLARRRGALEAGQRRLGDRLAGGLREAPGPYRAQADGLPGAHGAGEPRRRLPRPRRRRARPGAAHDHPRRQGAGVRYRVHRRRRRRLHPARALAGRQRRRTWKRSGACSTSPPPAPAAACSSPVPACAGGASAAAGPRSTPPSRRASCRRFRRTWSTVPRTRRTWPPSRSTPCSPTSNAGSAPADDR